MEYIDINTAKIISQIAEIQVEALKKLKANPKQIVKDQLMKLLETTENEIMEALDNHIQIYKDMIDNVSLINLLTEYQTSLCSYILWKMESEWMITNQEGVLGAWSIITRAQRKFHPEYLIIL